TKSVPSPLINGLGTDFVRTYYIPFMAKVKRVPGQNPEPGMEKLGPKEEEGVWEMENCGKIAF
ncbi:MAG: hypothetical protein Q8941_02720, partial [Bacteroidota bacterium]|nr:hypothetical protein [Bacteroidota bacterium]